MKVIINIFIENANDIFVKYNNNSINIYELVFILYFRNY